MLLICCCSFDVVVVGLQCDVEDSVLSHPVLQEELNNPKNGDSAHKHLKQQVTSAHRTLNRVWLIFDVWLNLLC